MKVLFDLRNLSIHRSGVHILDDVKWRVKAGEHWVILGANGSGKTSLLKALTGYMTPTRGEITLLGQDYGGSDWRALRKRIGVVSSSISRLVHDEDSGLEIVVGGTQAMIGCWGRISRSERERARRVLSLLRVPQAVGRSWEVLSQGERQRVLIARALMANVRKLAKRKSAPGLVLVTHHIEEIVPEFTHVLALRGGRVVYAGPKSSGLNGRTLEKIFDAPLSVWKSDSRYYLRGISPAR